MTDYNGIIAGIARLVDQTIRSRRLSDIFSGSVTGTSPLTVKADGHELGEEFLVNCCSAALSVGDAVVLIRKEGGQRYYLISKIV